jgi:uncharacterized protein
VLVNNEKRLAAASFSVCMAMLLLVTAALAAPKVPSIDQVYQAARTGHLAQAEAMTREVLQAYPNSARAHYVMAQILAAEGRSPEARAYLDKAERLRPGLPFASPESVAKLERRINSAAPVPVEHRSTNQIPWWWLVAGAVVVFLVLRAFRRRSLAPRDYSSGQIGAGGVSPGSGPSVGGYGGGGYGGGLLSSVLGGLGFGAAAAAGQRVMDRVLGGEQRDEPTQPEIQQSPSASDDLGGDAFGVQPGEGSSGGWEDSRDQTSASPDAPDDLGGGDSGNGGWDDSSGGGGDVDV